MKLGMLYLFENPVGYTEHEVVKNQIELMIEAERLGYDSVWPAEHHFSEYGYCASPQVSLAAVAARRRSLSRRATLVRAAELYAERHADAEGRLPATFQVIYLTAWAPHASQQQPLRPGSARARLADALGTVERSAGEPAGPTPRGRHQRS